MINLKRLTYTAGILLIIFSCSATFPSRKKNVESGILLEITMQLANVLNGEVKLGEEVFSTEIFQLKDVTVYKVPMFRDSSLIQRNKEGEFLSEKFLGIDTLYKYYLFHKSKKTGLEFDPLHPEKASPFNVDSLTKSHAFNNIDVDGYHLISSKSPKAQQSEVYDIDAKKVNEPDQMLLEYDQSYTDIDHYSFSHKLDSLKKSKLIQVKYVINENKNIPRLETTLKIIKLPIRPKVTAELESVLAKTEGKF